MPGRLWREFPRRHVLLEIRIVWTQHRTHHGPVAEELNALDGISTTVHCVWPAAAAEPMRRRNRTPTTHNC